MTCVYVLHMLEHRGNQLERLGSAACHAAYMPDRYVPLR